MFILGTKLGEIMSAEVISLDALSGRAIAIDAFNTLYQFLATVRQPDGTPLMDSHGLITSHLSGLFYRNIHLFEYDIRPVYVFDGEAPRLKAPEVQRRRALREAAFEEWLLAKEEGRIEDARRAAQASSSITSEMIEESKALLRALGIPVIQAPSEGEALAAQMARHGVVWASASQDNDSLLYNSPRMIRNLSISGRRRVSRTKTYKTVSPELIDLDVNLRILGITRAQLIDIAILVGTDYNDKTEGVGPKTALKLIKTYGSLEGVMAAKGIRFEFPIDEIRSIFLDVPEVKIPELVWSPIDEEAILRLLCSTHDFSEERVRGTLTRLREHYDANRDTSFQSSLSDFM